MLSLELTVLAFVRAIRTSDFDLYMETLSQLVPWFFALDHVHYARWIPVHIRDMTNLRQQCPDIHEHFMRGAFTSNKTGNPYSAIGLPTTYVPSSLLWDPFLDRTTDLFKIDSQKMFCHRVLLKASKGFTA